MAAKPPHQSPQSPAAQLRGRGGAQRLPVRVACLMMPAAVGTRLLRGAPHSHAYETSSPDDLSSLLHTHRRMSCASTHASLAISTHPYPCATHGLRRLRSLVVRSTGGVALESQSMTHHHHTPCCVGPCARTHASLAFSISNSLLSPSSRAGNDVGRLRVGRLCRGCGWRCSHSGWHW